MTISNLPPEIIQMVLDNLDSRSLLRFRRSCRHFDNNVVSFWMHRKPKEAFRVAICRGNTQRVEEYLDRYYSRVEPPIRYIIDYNDIQDALVIASAHGRLDIMKSLFSRESLLLETESYSGLPLAFAAHDGQMEAVRLLLSYGADPDISASYRLPVQVAANEHIRRVLIRYAGAHTLGYLVETDSVENVRYMLKHNRISNVHQDMLEIAAERNNLEMVDVLLSYGFRKSQGAFVRAIGTRNLKLARKLAQDPNKEYEGRRPLHHAVRSSSAQMIVFLLGCGANRTLQDAYGRSPIALAKELGKWEMASALMGYHHPYNLRPRRGYNQEVKSDHPPAARVRCVH